MYKVFAAIAFAACFSGCADSPPPIGRNLPSQFAEARPVFNQRVTERFPTGSSEQALVTELRREGFVLTAISPPDEYQSRATYTAGQIVCKATWTIVWGAADAKITAIAANYGAVCL
jgi:hypothetical protein